MLIEKNYDNDKHINKSKYIELFDNDLMKKNDEDKKESEEEEEKSDKGEEKENDRRR